MKIIISILLFSLLGLKNNVIGQPTISSFAPTAGQIGAEVIIIGTNFNSILANNIVFFGGTKATVMAGSITSLTVKVPLGASYQPISVTDNSTGLTAYSKKPFNVIFPCGGELKTSIVSKVDYYETGDDTRTVLSNDLDGDGKPDVITINYSSSTVSVLKNTSNIGKITLASKVDFSTGLQPSSVSIVDFDGDGKPDIAITNFNSNSLSILRNTTSGGVISFDAKVDFVTGLQPSSVSSGDFDGDGKIDLAITNYNSVSVSILKNISTKGVISFADKFDIKGIPLPVSITTNDFDGDRKCDFAVSYITNSKPATDYS